MDARSSKQSAAAQLTNKTSPVPPLSSIGTWWRTRIATIHEKLGTLTDPRSIVGLIAS